MAHVYNSTFFNYIDRGSRASAQAFIANLKPLLEPQSIADFGSGRGAWLAEWQAAGVEDILGLDGDYVDRDQLAIPPEKFQPVDLTSPLDLGRRFDLAQSLEVGEHLPESAATTLVESLTKHADRILFSAAVRGQGGEFHLNEQPLHYWQSLFEAQGYHAFDCVRPAVAENMNVEPWYRYNTVLYVNAAGQAGLPDSILSTKVIDKVCDSGGLSWKLRKRLVLLMPRPLVTFIARAQAAIIARWIAR